MTSLVNQNFIWEEVSRSSIGVIARAEVGVVWIYELVSTRYWELTSCASSEVNIYKDIN